MNPSQPDTPGCLPLSVWATAQQAPRAQRRDRYLPESDAHPAKMFPAIAKHSIHAYTGPGDLVIDPMCGIGTTLVEAVHAGRDAVGVEYEQRWADLAARNIAYAADRGASGQASVVHGDARAIGRLLGDGLSGRAALVLTSPPYGPRTHGKVLSTRDSGRPGVRTWSDSYGHDRNNLARRPVGELMDGFAQILIGCRPLLKPGGFVVIVSRPFRRAGRLVDIPSMAADAVREAGFGLHERCVALLAAVGDDGLTGRASFFQQINARNAIAEGNPTHVRAHEEVIVARLLPEQSRPRTECEQDIGCGASWARCDAHGTTA